MADVKIHRITTGYMPRPWQDYVHRNMKRFNVIVAHRRSGKTHLAFNELLHAGLNNPNRNPQYAYIAPTFSQAKRIVWSLAKDYVKNLPNVETNEQELRLDIFRPQFQDKVRIMLLGAENPDSLRGIYLDGCVLDEFGTMNPIVWTQVVRPALSDRRGWVVFVGTPNGPNTFKDLYEYGKANPNDWFVQLLTANDTKIIPQEELDMMRATMSEAEFNQEIMCDWSAANSGSYYGKLLNDAQAQGRICKVPYDKALPVITSWDLGIGDTTAIWFIQPDRQSYRVIDHYETSGQDLEHYVKVIKERRYNYEEHIFPHDVKARDLSSGNTREQTLRQLGLRIRALERSKIEDRINATRLLLPKCYFDEVKCDRGLRALWAYEAKWDAKNQIFSDKPLHNWASNSADSFGYFAMGNVDFGRKERWKNLPRVADMNWNPFSKARY